MTSALTPALARAGLPRPILDTFECMGIAEDLLGETGLRGHAFAFLVLAPPEELLGLDRRVYRSHARELLARIGNASVEFSRNARDPRTAKLLGTPTKAEVLAGMSRASLKSPPGATWGGLMGDLFAEVMGIPAPGQEPHEPWPGARAELLAEMLRRQVPRNLGDPA